jgi:predicted lipid-binding transport protein (Tim44 family)
MQVVFAATQSIPPGETEPVTVNQIGLPTIEPYTANVRENKGMIQMPFVSETMQAIAKCTDSSLMETAEDEAFCQMLKEKYDDIDAETLAHCVQYPMDEECREIMADVVQTASNFLESSDVTKNESSGQTAPSDATTSPALANNEPSNASVRPSKYTTSER